MVPPLLEQCRRHPVVGLSMCACTCGVCEKYWKFVYTISCKPLMEISAHLQLWCSWAQRFWGQEDKGHSHSRTTLWSSKHFGRYFSLVPGMRGRVLMKFCHTYSLSHPHEMDDISRSQVERSRSQTAFPKMHVLSGGIAIDGAPSKTV